MPDPAPHVVTGASSGIGLEIARGLARTGVPVILVGRDPEKTDRALADVRASTGNDQITALRADFSSLDEVRRLAEQILDHDDRVGVLVNNAGLWHPKLRLSQDGYEDTMAVNHLAPFLLTHLLLPALKRAAPSRVVNVSSRLHARPRRLDFDTLRPGGKYAGMKAYQQSKLANVLFTRELARRVQGDDIIVNAVHPGDVAATGVTRESPLLRVGARLVWRFFDSPEKGARTPLHAALSDDVQGVTGAYFHDCRLREPSPAAQDDGAARRLWERSAEITRAG